MAFFIFTVFRLSPSRRNRQIARVAKQSVPYSTPMKWFSSLISGIQLLFAGLWLVIRIILEYFGIISDGNDRTTGIKDMREEYKKAGYR